MAVVSLIAVFVGFARTYFLAGMFRAPLPNLLVHIHGAAFTLWEVPFTPWGLAKFKERRANLSKDDPESYCLPPGVPRYAGTPYPSQFIQLLDRIVREIPGNRGRTTRST